MKPAKKGAKTTGVAKQAPPVAAESKIQRCAPDLSSADEVLLQESDEPKHLERELSDSEDELVDSQAKEKKAPHLALHDPLTGLPNRYLFNDRLHHALAQAKRHGWSLAVMFIDLDKFKKINDAYGRDAGDKVLKTVAHRLQASVRAMDTVCRQDGDEFFYLMLEVQDGLHAAVRAGKIIHTVSAACEVNGMQIIVEASVGIAIYPQDGETAEALLKNADTAMYKAKQNNEGYSFFSSSRP